MTGAVSNTLFCMQMTAIFVADKCLSKIETIVQIELEIVGEWLVDIKRSLHLCKTRPILLGPDLGYSHNYF